MRTFIYLIFLLSFCGAKAQNATAIGANIGFAIPVMKQSNSEIDRPSQGLIAGLRLERVISLGEDNIFFSGGLQAYVYFFNHSGVHYSSEPTGPLGLSVGVPLNLMIQFPIDNYSAVRVFGGIIPMIETGGLARASDADGAFRPNIAPNFGINLYFLKNTSFGLKWFMPLRLYGSNTLHSTYRLHSFTFDVMRTLDLRKKKDIKQKNSYKKARS